MQDKPEITTALNKFVEYAHRLKGDEKGEAQVFCDRLFRAFGHEGYKEAGAVLEFRVRAKDVSASTLIDGLGFTLVDKLSIMTACPSTARKYWFKEKKL